MALGKRLIIIARLGFAARGLVYILVGWLAFDASVTGADAADNEGALGSLADSDIGRVILGFCALGFAGYAFWRFTEAALDPEDRSRTLKGRLERAAYVVSGGANVSLSLVAGNLALQQSRAQGGSPGDQNAQSWSAWLLNQPGGVFFLILVGILLFATAATQAVKSYKGRFDELDGAVPAPDYVRWIGRLGYGARAVVFAIIGWLLILAALNHQPEQAGGFGEALDQLRAQPKGAIVLGIVGLGLGLFGLFSLVEARFRHLQVTIPSPK